MIDIFCIFLASTAWLIAILYLLSRSTSRIKTGINPPSWPGYVLVGVGALAAAAPMLIGGL